MNGTASKAKGRADCVDHKQAGRYARVRRSGTNRLMCLHVRIWEEQNGPKPEGFDIHHTCGNERCINIDHLEALPSLEHQRLHAPRLTKEIAEQIRREYDELPRADKWPVQRSKKVGKPYPERRVVRGARAALAEKYGIRPDLLKQVIRRTVWA